MRRRKSPRTNQQRREIKAEPGTHEAVAKKFGVTPAYVSMLKSGYRPLQFSPVEVMNASLISLACGAQ